MYNEEIRLSDVGFNNTGPSAIGNISEATNAGGSTDWFTANAPTASAPTTGAPTTDNTGVAGDAAFDEFGRQWLASGGRTVADLKAFADKWNAANPRARVTLGGSKGDKVYGPNGEFWNDAVIAAGLGGQGGSWGARGGGGGGAAGGDVNLGGFGSLAKGWEQTFKAPSIDEIRAMPGYQFALQEGIKGLDAMAAARGTGMSGGFKKDVMQYATGLADQTAQTKYQNALGEYMNAYNIFRNNQNDVFNRFDTLAGRGTAAAGAATS